MLPGLHSTRLNNPLSAARGSGNAGAAGSQPAYNKENFYNQLLAQNQPEQPWIETFQAKLKVAFKGKNSEGQYSESSDRLPQEVRTAQSALRHSRGQFSHTQSASQDVQRHLLDEQDFVNALINKRKNASAV